MRRTTCLPVVALLSAALAGCATLPQSAAVPVPVSDSVIVQRIADAVEAGTRDTSGTASWGLPSAEQRRANEAREDQWSAELARIDGTALYGPNVEPSSTWRTYGLVREAVESSRALRVCRFPLWNVDPIFGWQANAGFNAESSPVSTETQRDSLINSFRKLPAVAALNISDLKQGAREGYTAPRAIVDRVVAEINEMLADTSAMATLRSPMRRDTSASFRREWTAVLEQSVYPALRSYRDFLVSYAPSTRASTSLASLPNGSACYRAQLRAVTTVDTPPDSLVAIAEAVLPSYRARIQPIGLRMFGTSDVVASMRHARTDSALVMTDPDSILAAYAAFVARARAPLARYFEPIADESLVVVAVPRAQAASFPPAAYNQAPLDGSAPASLAVNAFQPGGVARMNVALGTVHEGYPGHHWQYLVAKAHATGAVPNISFNSGYVEGWAIYAETLGDEMGVYQSDADSIGYLIHMVDVFTALEMDAGLHGLGWSRAQVIDSMMQVAGRPQRQAESYADRSAASPAQLASYAIGYLAIRKLRDRAEAALGSRFDIKAFHAEILDDGSMPLGMLGTKVDRWIAAQVAPGTPAEARTAKP